MSQNLLDKFISFVSPRAGATRARYRKIETLLRAYDGATSGRRTEGWITGAGSAISETRAAIEKLRDRARDMVRNDPYAKRAVTVIPANIVGAGILPRALTDDKAAFKKWAELWKAWGETTECDADGLMNFYGLQYLVTQTIVESGECLIRKRPRRLSDGLTVPLQLQVLEPDFIDTRQDGTMDGNYTNVQGIEYDQLGRRAFYNLYREHPGGGIRSNVYSTLQSVRIPADQIIHLFRVDRAGQVRGVTWLAPLMLKLRDYSDFSDATLMRQKIAACFAGFVKETDNSNLLTATATPPIADAFEPGMIEILKPGQEIEIANPPAPTGFSEFSREQLRACATGLGISYEALTGDFSQVNFSSGRMGRLEMQRNIDAWRWNLLIPRACTGVWNWFAFAAVLAGEMSETVSANWTPPRREMIDPSKETSAIVDGVRSGLQTLSEAIRENGFDPDEVFAEYAADNAKLDQYKLTLDSDPRKVGKAGSSGSSASDSSSSADQTKGGENGT